MMNLKITPRNPSRSDIIPARGDTVVHDGISYKVQERTFYFSSNGEIDYLILGLIEV